MQSISAEDILERIKIDNPWWHLDRSVGQALRAMKPRAYFTLFMPLVRDRSVRRALVLMGPRRVGKTVMIHHAIQALLDEGIPARSIGYISVDHPILNGLSLDRLLDFYSQASGVNFKETPTYVFFDEIQYLREWEVHLKSAVDTFDYPKFIVSGSAAAALRLKSDESGAGRFTDFSLPPLTFYEYLDLLGKSDFLVKDDRVQAPEMLRSTDYSARNMQQLNDQFLQYLNFGGYPEVIFSPTIQSDPARFIKSDIIDKVLLRDLPSLYGISDIQELNYLFTTLAFNSSQEISLGQLSMNSGVAKNTIKRYIEYLEAAFLIRVVHRVDRNTKRFRRANFFKVYLTNPSMRAALFSPLKLEDPAMGAMTETAIYSQWFHGSTVLYYARWQDGEVDIVHLGNDQRAIWAVEVKWSDRHCDRPNELKEYVGFCKANGMENILITSKTRKDRVVIDDVEVAFVPASIYCYTVGLNLVRGRGVKRTLKPPTAFEESSWQ